MWNLEQGGQRKTTELVSLTDKNDLKMAVIKLIFLMPWGKMKEGGKIFDRELWVQSYRPTSHRKKGTQAVLFSLKRKK